MEISIVKLPKDLRPEHLNDRVVVVFDVLRATTTMATAIASRAKEVRVFGSLDAAKNAASEFSGEKILAGEKECLPPAGFDLGNSPCDCAAERVSGKTIFLSTTNGTKAIVAAKGAARIFAAGLVNARATGLAVRKLGMDVTLLCSGTEGEFSPEDNLGAEMVRHAIEDSKEPLLSHDETMKFLHKTQGGQNIVRAGLKRDIEFAARMDQFDVVVEVTGDPPIARRMQ
ncbi:MAG TPA: 2-phosphosulfolactate phosphatase [Tepidisphaeraceae bacterium]|jgi:2-phosphosulfolactate phosphatase|nr:2-phosphosulfolactate phosphatase [Tepidisphaeraceae bacterium]